MSLWTGMTLMRMERQIACKCLWGQELALCGLGSRGASRCSCRQEWTRKLSSLPNFLWARVSLIWTGKISSLQMSLLARVSPNKGSWVSSLLMSVWTGASPTQASKVRSLQMFLWSTEGLTGFPLFLWHRILRSLGDFRSMFLKIPGDLISIVEKVSLNFRIF